MQDDRGDVEAAAITIEALGELALLQALKPYCAAAQLRDDAAVLSWDAAGPEPGALVVTTDMLVDGVHFSDRTTSPGDVGWRAAAANLSDLAAMGATPVGLTVGLSVPGTTALAWVEGVYAGLAACLATYGGEIIGGDVCRSTIATLSITALGRVSPHRVLRRQAAQPGDAIVVTGSHGASRAGLELLLQPEWGADLPSEWRSQWQQAHQRPLPRLDVLPVLWSVVDRQPEWGDRGLAAMDSSDGLANAVLHLCQESGVGATLLRSQLPWPPGFTTALPPDRQLDWLLYGGEDFELVLGLPLPLAQAFCDRQPGSQIIGTFTAARAVIVHDPTGQTPDLPLTFAQGFQHF